MRRLLFPAAVAAAALLAGGVATYLVMRHTDPQSPPTAAPASSAALPRCADMFRPGEPIRVPIVGPQCTDPDGTAVILAAFRCNDGRHLWQVDARFGVVAGYGFDNSPYQAGASSTPGYAAAYATCHGNPAGSQTP